MNRYHFLQLVVSNAYSTIKVREEGLERLKSGLVFRVRGERHLVVRRRSVYMSVSTQATY